MLYCTLPICGDSAHKHLFNNDACRNGKHTNCTGTLIKLTPISFDEKTIINKHIKEAKEVYEAGLTTKNREYWVAAEKQREDWEIFISVRDGKKKPPKGPQVWTCKCGCHESRVNWTVWSWMRGHTVLPILTPEKEKQANRTIKNGQLSKISCHLSMPGKIRLANWIEYKNGVRYG